MGTMGRFLLTLLLVALLIAISMFGCGFCRGWGAVRENFENITSSIEEEVIRSFQTILQRDPTIEELKTVTKDIQQGNSSIHKLQLQMISSDEYQRMMKTQSNTVTPELMRVIAEREYLEKIGNIYRDVFEKKIPSDLVLPYHDLYVFVFKRDDLLLRNLFLDPRYEQFEEDVLSSKELNREDLFDLYNTTFVRKDPRTPVEMPKAAYMVPEGSLASDASMWVEMDKNIGGTVIPPWKSLDQEETTYSLYEKEDGQAAPPVEVRPPVMPPTTPPAQVPPVDVSESLPQPRAPLQGSLVGANLSTSPLTVETMKVPTVVAMPIIASKAPIETYKHEKTVGHLLREQQMEANRSA